MATDLTLEILREIRDGIRELRGDFNERLRLKLGPRRILVLLLLAAQAICGTAPANAKNSGHQGGCDPQQGGLAEFPKNSIICLRAVVHGVALEIGGEETIKIGPVRTRPDFQHLEIDVEETQDHQLLVYRGRKGRLFKRRRDDAATIRHEFLNARLFSAIQQAMAERSGTRRSWKSVRVADLTLVEIQSLYLEGDLVQRAPTLAEYLSEARRLQYDGKLMINVDALRSEAAGARLLSLVADFEATAGQRNPAEDMSFDVQRIGILVSSTTTQDRVFGSGCASERFRRWSSELHDRKVRVYRTGGGKQLMVLPRDCGD